MLSAAGSANVQNETKVDDFPFDQEERHRLFWQFIRDKEWKSAASFIDKKVLL